MKQKNIRFVFILFLVFLILGCGPEKEKIYKKSKMTMDTIVTLSVVSESSGKAEKAMEKTFKEIEMLEKYLNNFSPDSEVSEINRQAGKNPVKVSPETMEVINRAIHISEKTKGAFDVTIGAVSKLWNFHDKVKPDEKTVKQALPLVNYKNMIVNKKNQTIYLTKKEMSVDLGGIAKGYAADRAVGVLKKEGIKSGLVALAGEIKAFGLRPDKKPWRIGIQNPRQKGKDDEVIATMDLTDAAISTSGDYQRYFIENGKRYHHILNPKTGYPADECMSVTVIARGSTALDGFPTGVFVLGREKGLKLIESLGFDGVIVGKEGKIFVTPNLKGKIKILGNKKNN
jgi:thiamine biosynthesis lipoprotein